MTGLIVKPCPASHRVKVFLGGLAQSASTFRVKAAVIPIITLVLAGCARHHVKAKPIELHSPPVMNEPENYYCSQYIDLDTMKETASSAWCESRTLP